MALDFWGVEAEEKLGQWQHLKSIKAFSKQCNVRRIYRCIVVTARNHQPVEYLTYFW